MAMSKHPSPVTIYAVAEAAGVSIATVSRVLSRPDVVAAHTRARVRSAIADLDYVPAGSARSLAVRQNEAHGLVLPELSGPYYSELLTGYEAAAADAGQSVVLMLAFGKTDLVRAVRNLAAKVDGIAVLGSIGLPGPVLAGLVRSTPVMVIAGDPADGIEAVNAENRSSTMALTRHLMDHGRSKLLFLGDPQSAPDVRDRYAGFVDAYAADARVGGRRSRASDRAPAPIAMAFVESEGARIADEIATGRLDADALVCANDEVALAVIHRLKQLGLRVPADVAVVGFDDLMAARYVEPGLTTVRQPVRELGSLIATRLHDRIGGAPARSAPTVLPTELVIRQSCGCPAPDIRQPADAASAPLADPNRRTRPITVQHEGVTP
jgi:LacI family transcriptional regulator